MIHNLNLDEKEVDSEIDKVHRVGKPKDGKQATILRFKSHSFRAKVYEKRKSIINKKLKVRVSLTKKRSDLIKYAYSITEDKPLNLKFVFADINGNLKLRLEEPFDNRYVYSFEDQDELHLLFQKFNWTLPPYN